MKRILIIDDDENIRAIVNQNLINKGYETWLAQDGVHALEIIRHRGLPHLAIVDIQMPRMGGFEFCDMVHRDHSNLPIIFLSAERQENLIARGINNYAEDYVRKPFSGRELTARIDRVLRRIRDFDYALDPIVRIDDRLELDLAHNRAFVDGRKIKLTPIEKKILQILFQNAPHIVTSSRLLTQLWPNQDCDEAMLRVHMHRLRKKIEKHSKTSEYIFTERGKGYRLSAENTRTRRM